MQSMVGEWVWEGEEREEEGGGRDWVARTGVK